MSLRSVDSFRAPAEDVKGGGAFGYNEAAGGASELLNREASFQVCLVWVFFLEVEIFSCLSKFISNLSISSHICVFLDSDGEARAPFCAIKMEEGSCFVKCLRSASKMYHPPHL